MKTLSKISLLLVVVIVFIASAGVNITKHSCASCGVEDVEIGMLSIHHHENSEHFHIDDMHCSSKQTKCCIENINLQDHHKDKKHDSCCDFDNDFLKIINLFTPEENLDISSDFIVFFTYDFFYNSSTINTTKSLKDFGLFHLKILPNKPILSEICSFLL